jgi:hypothetical protein
MISPHGVAPATHNLEDSNMTKHNIYGVTVDTEEPITGVIHNNSAEWLSDEIMNGVDMAWEDHLVECEEEYHDHCGPQEMGTVFIGFMWEKDEKGEVQHRNAAGEVETGWWAPDPEAEFGAIVGETDTQIICSVWITRAHHCSPCYPGSADLGTPGEFLAYTFPPEMFGDNDEHLPIEEYTEGKLKRLKAQAAESYMARGHRMDEWIDHNPHHATSDCLECKMGVAVNTHPAPNQINISGSAVALECPRREHE